MGKLLVAQGLGATVLPDFSVLGSPLERSGAIVCRRSPMTPPVCCRCSQLRRAESVPPAARDLHAALVRRARELAAV